MPTTNIRHIPQRSNTGDPRYSYGSSKNSFVMIGTVLKVGALDAPGQELSFAIWVCNGEIPVGNASSAAAAAFYCQLRRIRNGRAD